MAVSLPGMVDEVFLPPDRIAKNAHVQSMQDYKQMYKQSVEEPQIFWKNIADQFYWKSLGTDKFLTFNFDVQKGPIFIKWMEGAKTNICYNCLDKHVNNNLGDRVAFFW